MYIYIYIFIYIFKYNIYIYICTAYTRCSLCFVCLLAVLYLLRFACLACLLPCCACCPSDSHAKHPSASMLCFLFTREASVRIRKGSRHSKGIPNRETILIGKFDNMLDHNKWLILYLFEEWRFLL